MEAWHLFELLYAHSHAVAAFRSLGPPTLQVLLCVDVVFHWVAACVASNVSVSWQQSQSRCRLSWHQCKFWG